MTRIIPIYLVVNTSNSMTGRLVEVGHLLDAFQDELLCSPMLGDRVRLCVVGFSEFAQIVLPLSDLTEIATLPKLPASQGVRFAPMFDLLTRRTASDVLANISAGNSVDWPMVLIITDCIPNDYGWERAYEALYRSSRPRMLLFITESEKIDDETLLDLEEILSLSALQVLAADKDNSLTGWILDTLMEYVDGLTLSKQTIYYPEHDTHTGFLIPPEDV